MIEAVALWGAICVVYGVTVGGVRWVVKASQRGEARRFEEARRERIERDRV